MNLVNMLAGQCSIDIDPIVPGTIRAFVTILKIAIPIILIVFGILDLSKAVMANDDKEMKEAQKKLIKRIVYAVVVFFVIALVQFVFKELAKADSDNSGNNVKKGDITSCIACFVSDKDSCYSEKGK